MYWIFPLPTPISSNMKVLRVTTSETSSQHAIQNRQNLFENSNTWRIGCGAGDPPTKACLGNKCTQKVSLGCKLLITESSFYRWRCGWAPARRWRPPHCAQHPARPPWPAARLPEGHPHRAHTRSVPSWSVACASPPAALSGHRRLPSSAPPAHSHQHTTMSVVYKQLMCALSGSSPQHNGVGRSACTGSYTSV